MGDTALCILHFCTWWGQMVSFTPQPIYLHGSNMMLQVAEQFLYHWKTFPIILPPPLAVSNPPTHQHQHQNSTGGNNSEFHGGGVAGSTDNSGSSLSLARRSNKHLNMRDLFLAPSFDELDAVAVDSKGEPRRLSNKQLESIRERG